MANTINSITARSPVTLPPMSGEREAAEIYSSIQMAHSKLIGNNLVFDEVDGMKQSLEQGFFLVKIPEDVDTTAGDVFAENWFKARDGGNLDPFRGYRELTVPGEDQGYFDREHDQFEHFFIELTNWSLLPNKVAQLGHQMTDIGITILCNVLDYLSIPEQKWAKLTSGLLDKRGFQMLVFNHYRSSKPVRGSKFHRDTGLVTVLRSTESGLLALIEGQLYAINPEPGYFIVNFGSCMEMLTEKMPIPVRANIHGVVRTERKADSERTSYAVFLDSSLDGTIYQYESGRIQALQSVAEFLVQEVSRIYADDSNL